MAGYMMSAPLGTLHRHGQTSLRGLCPLSQRPNRVGRLSFQCRVQKRQEGDSLAPGVAVPLAAALAASIMLSGAVFPEEALAARSGGRVGGSAFRSAPRAAPRSAPSPGPSRTYNYNNYSAPPLVGGYGYGGGFGGINVFPSFGVPVFGLGGGFFNFVLIAFVFSAVTGVVRSLLGGRRRNDNDDFD